MASGSLRALLIVAFGATSLGSPALGAALGETYACHFGRYGKVVIDTREPGSTITIKGKTYPAVDGSYFYQANDGKIVVYFGPRMGFWEYEGVRDRRCVRRPNH